MQQRKREFLYLHTCNRCKGFIIINLLLLIVPMHYNSSLVHCDSTIFIMFVPVHTFCPYNGSIFMPRDQVPYFNFLSRWRSFCVAFSQSASLSAFSIFLVSMVDMNTEKATKFQACALVCIPESRNGVRFLRGWDDLCFKLGFLIGDWAWLVPGLSTAWSWDTCCGTSGSKVSCWGPGSSPSPFELFSTSW